MTTTTSTLTRDPSVPAAVASAGTPPGVRPRLQLWIAIASVVLLIGLLVAAVLPTIPYLALQPGSAREVGDLIHVEGAATYPPKQSVAFTTVNQREATLADAFRGWIDDDIEVVPTELLRGGQSREQTQRYNAQLMDTSKAAAATVALRRLGYEVAIHTSGTVVRSIVEGTPAARVLELDDVIVGVDGQPVDEIGELRELLQVGGVGAAHTLTVERPAGSTTRVEVPITTERSPDDPTRAVIGIREPEERLSGFDFPVHIEIDSGQVGGPSAGLAFALAILDVLTPGELTGGKKVATTGTIDFDGVVGPVGGAIQKAVAVRNAGYEVFLVPSDEFAEVQGKVGGDLQVIAVDTLQEALDALAALGGDRVSLEPAGATSAP